MQKQRRASIVPPERFQLRNNDITPAVLAGFIALACVFTLTACDSPAAPKGAAPTVTGVRVSPGSTNVVKGGTAAFTATVQGTNNPAQTVTWSVSGGGAATAISAAGVLTVAAGETTGAVLTVRAASTVDAGKSGTAAVTVVLTVPALTGSVTISGDPQVNTVLTADITALNGDGEPSFVWQRAAALNGTYTPISGENSPTYTVRDNDRTAYLNVTVSRAGYSGSVRCATPKGPVAAALLDFTGAVTITGPAMVFGLLTLDSTALAPAGLTLTCQWQRAPAPAGPYTDIPGATDPSYTLSAADEGAYLKVTVSSAGYRSLTSPATERIAPPQYPEHKIYMTVYWGEEVFGGTHEIILEDRTEGLMTQEDVDKVQAIFYDLETNGIGGQMLDDMSRSKFDIVLSRGLRIIVDDSAGFWQKIVDYSTFSANISALREYSSDDIKISFYSVIINGLYSMSAED
jgi:hypothetical protein